jgi:hypothetical protein
LWCSRSIVSVSSRTAPYVGARVSTSNASPRHPDPARRIGARALATPRAGAPRRRMQPRGPQAMLPRSASPPAHGSPA